MLAGRGWLVWNEVSKETLNFDKANLIFSIKYKYPLIEICIMAKN